MMPEYGTIDTFKAIRCKANGIVSTNVDSNIFYYNVERREIYATVHSSFH